MLNYLERLRNPTPYQSFMPPELLLYGERRIIDAFENAPPDVIAIVDKDTSEYGLPVFGKGYGQMLMKWVGDNYQETTLFGHRPLTHEGFGILLMKRRALAKIAPDQKE